MVCHVGKCHVSYKIRFSIQTENNVQENSYPKKRDLSYVAARSLNYKTHDKNKTSAPVSATGADGYRVVDENVSQSLQDEVKE